MDENKNLKNQKAFLIVGRIASIMSVLMYVSYLAQITSNLQGHKGNPLQPFVAALNSTLWVLYGWMNPHDFGQLYRFPVFGYPYRYLNQVYLFLC